MHPDKTSGRFGVSTNQTLKKNSYIRIQEKAVSHYHIDGEAAAFSLNKHKAWELLDQATCVNAQDVETQSESNILENTQSRKKQVIQQHPTKSKHDIRLQKKELSKLKKNIEQEKLNKSLATTTNVSESSEELSKIVKTRVGASHRYARGVSIPENGILISEVMSRGQIYKLMQHRDRVNNSSCDKSRHKKKEEFEKSIFV